MQPQDIQPFWLIARVYRRPKEYPPEFPGYVMTDHDGPMRFDRQKDAVRHISGTGRSHRNWEAVKMYEGDDGKLRQAWG